MTGAAGENDTDRGAKRTLAAYAGARVAALVSHLQHIRPDDHVDVRRERKDRQTDGHRTDALHFTLWTWPASCELTEVNKSSPSSYRHEALASHSFHAGFVDSKENK